MREIKFRGKRVNNGEWVLGDFILLNGKAHIYERKNEFGGSGSWEVDPTTVGQFTDRHDKNGERIYEGDIAQERFGTLMKYHVVEYFPGYFEFKDTDGFVAPISLDKDVEVIGNIHDNPELLKTE